MKNTLRFLPVILIPLALGACGHGDLLYDDPDIDHAIHVSTSSRDINLVSDGKGHVVIEEGGYVGIATDYVKRGHGPLMITGSNSDVMSVVRNLVNSGVPSGKITPSIIKGQTGVSIKFIVYSAEIDTCGQFKSDKDALSSTPYNKASSDWGCANNRNLAIMISDPRDLMRRRGSEGTTISVIPTQAVTAYQTPTAPVLDAKAPTTK